MIRIQRPPPPPELYGEDSEGAKERKQWEEYWKQVAENSEVEKPKFEAYKLARKALEDFNHRKCAYCEARIGHILKSEDIEHWRPKGAVIRNDGSRLKHGYWWLAADWDNLLPSCPSCNRRGEHFITDEDRKRVSGKGMYFPLKDEEKRATEPGMEAEEEPLLLHPCNDEPPEHLAFVVEKGADEAWVLPKCDSLGERDEKGDTSIRLLGLNRFQLVKDSAREA